MHQKTSRRKLIIWFEGNGPKIQPFVNVSLASIQSPCQCLVSQDRHSFHTPNLLMSSSKYYTLHRAIDSFALHYTRCYDPSWCGSKHPYVFLVSRFVSISSSAIKIQENHLCQLVVLLSSNPSDPQEFSIYLCVGSVDIGVRKVNFCLDQRRLSFSGIFPIL